jgi:hypothetical protein
VPKNYFKTFCFAAPYCWIEDIGMKAIIMYLLEVFLPCLEDFNGR